MRITDVLRGQIHSQVGLVDGFDLREPAEARICSRILARILDEHARTMQPVLDLMRERLGERGFLAVLELDRRRMERDLGRIGSSVSPLPLRRARALAARFADHLAMCLYVALPVADRCLTETEILRLGEQWRAEGGGVSRVLEASPTREPGTGSTSY